jgi:hypothetical protein
VLSILPKQIIGGTTLSNRGARHRNARWSRFVNKCVVPRLLRLLLIPVYFRFQSARAYQRLVILAAMYFDIATSDALVRFSAGGHEVYKLWIPASGPLETA